MNSALHPSALYTAALYTAVLGEQFEGLHPALQRFHAGQSLSLKGRVTVVHGASILAKMLLWLMRLPKPCVDAPCAIRVVPQASKELWQRTLNGTAMRSQQFILNNNIAETLFLYTISLKTIVKAGQLWQRSVGGRVLGVPIPTCINMKIHAHERGINVQNNTIGFSFNVRMALPLLGSVLKYRGVFYFSNET